MCKTSNTIRTSTTTDSDKTSKSKRGTVQILSKNGPPYTFCNSTHSFEANSNSSAVNSTLNLNLGLPINPRDIKSLRYACKLLSDILGFVEVYAFRIMDKVPLRLRQIITMKAWALYFPLHKLTLSRNTGIHRDASLEYHALTTIMYWGRLFPMTIRRIRFSLSQMSVWHAHDCYPRIPRSVEKGVSAQYKTLNDVPVEEILFRYDFNKDVRKMGFTIQKGCALGDFPKSLSIKESDRPVSGYYIHRPLNAESVAPQNKKVLLWLYDGAFLGGDAEGNVAFANKISKKCDIDVFLPSYRLLPEYHFFDALEDVIRAFEYLIHVRGIKPDNVILLGISSGGGLIVRLLQRIVEVYDLANTTDQSAKKSLKALVNPKGAVLMSPFVEYTEPKGSFQHYTAHDLIVNQSVFEEGVPYFSTLGNDEARFKESPVNRAMNDLSPICLVVSEHECCYDQNIKLCNRAREAGVSVDLGVWKYLCHVWPVLSAFIPEARSAVDFMCDWIVKKKDDDEYFDVNDISVEGKSSDVK